jgi:hypothetical protein
MEQQMARPTVLWQELNFTGELHRPLATLTLPSSQGIIIQPRCSLPMNHSRLSLHHPAIAVAQDDDMDLRFHQLARAVTAQLQARFGDGLPIEVLLPVVLSRRSQ